MFRDNSLIPTEAVRLAALGFLAEAPHRYGDLAAEIRHFTGRIVGPSLDLMGTSLELMRFEGLIEAVDGEGMADNAVLRLTAAGSTALLSLLKAQLRSPLAEMNRLALFLKLRFLHHLSAEDQAAQRALITEALESERARLDELRRHPGAPMLFSDWLTRDIATLDDRIAWLRGDGG
jgi:DNA-binding PadR family transcriptional regulator